MLPRAKPSQGNDDDREDELFGTNCAEVALERDLERVDSHMSGSALIGVTVRSNSGDDAIRQLSVRPSQNIRDTIVEAFSCNPAQVEAVEFGGEAVEEGATYEDYGVEVGQPAFTCPGLALFF